MDGIGVAALGESVLAVVLALLGASYVVAPIDQGGNKAESDDSDFFHHICLLGF